LAPACHMEVLKGSTGFTCLVNHMTFERVMRHCTSSKTMVVIYLFIYFSNREIAHLISLDDVRNYTDYDALERILERN